MLHCSDKWDYESIGFLPLTSNMAMPVKRIPAPYVPTNPIVTCRFESAKAVQSHIPSVIAVAFPPTVRSFPVVSAGIDPCWPTENVVSKRTLEVST